MLPEQRTAVIVFTNLDSRFATDAHGLALGIAGMYVPEISLPAMKAKTDPDPARTKRVQEEFVRLAKGSRIMAGTRLRCSAVSRKPWPTSPPELLILEPSNRYLSRGVDAASRFH